MVQVIENKAAFDALINGSEPVVVDYWATWCGPCKLISPVFAKMEPLFPGIKFAKLDVEEVEDVAAEQGIRAMPTFIAYKNGKVFQEPVTGASPAKIEALVKKLAESA